MNTNLRKENITVGMRSACCFFISVFLAAAVASASTLLPADASKNEIWAAKMGNKLNDFIAKRYRFPISVGKGKGVSSSGMVKEDAPSTDNMDIPNSVDFARTGDKRFDMIEHQHKKKMSKGRKFKVCLNHGPCYMKKLVCPKKCNHKKAHLEMDVTSRHKKSHLKSKHVKGHCTFNCKKCIAHC